MKAKNWRHYYWYRPLTLTCPPKDPAVMRRQYVAWLRRTRGWAKGRAEDYVLSMSAATRAGGVIDGHDCKTYQRKVIWLSLRTAVRVVPCFTSAQGHYQPNYFDNGNGDPWSHWSARRTGGSGVTAYWVIRDGRMVDSYLTQARAMTKARDLAAADEREAIERVPQAA